MRPKYADFQHPRFWGGMGGWKQTADTAGPGDEGCFWGHADRLFLKSLINDGRARTRRARPAPSCFQTLIRAGGEGEGAGLSPGPRLRRQTRGQLFWDPRGRAFARR